MLTPSTLKSLVVKAQALRPVVMIGTKGLTPPVHQEIEGALKAHGLIKIRVSAPTREAKAEMITLIAAEHKATLINHIGHTAVFYRPLPVKKKGPLKNKKTAVTPRNHKPISKS